MYGMYQLELSGRKIGSGEVNQCVGLSKLHGKLDLLGVVRSYMTTEANCWRKVVEAYKRYCFFHKTSETRHSRRWRRVIYVTSLRRFFGHMELKVRRPEVTWLIYTTRYPWARVVPLIISLVRYSYIRYLAEELDRNMEEYLDTSHDRVQEDRRWDN